MNRRIVTVDLAIPSTVILYVCFEKCKILKRAIVPFFFFFHLKGQISAHI